MSLIKGHQIETPQRDPSGKQVILQVNSEGVPRGHVTTPKDILIIGIDWKH